MAITALSLATEVLILSTRAKETSDTQCIRCLNFSGGIQHGCFNTDVVILNKTRYCVRACVFDVCIAFAKSIRFTDPTGLIRKWKSQKKNRTGTNAWMISAYFYQAISEPNRNTCVKKKESTQVVLKKKKKSHSGGCDRLIIQSK